MVILTKIQKTISCFFKDNYWRRDLFSHRDIIPFRVIQGKLLKNYLLALMVHEIILQKEVERKK